MKKYTLVFSLCCFLLSSCSILKRNIVKETRGIEKDDYGLPIFLYPTKSRKNDKLLILLSGDGGWVKFEDKLASLFAQNGFVTLGFNSRNYFWNQKTPDELAEDISLIIKKYSYKYRTDKIYISGFSFGADVVPFIYNRLNVALKKRVIAMEMLSPYSTSDFEIHFADLINIAEDNYPNSVADEVKKVDIPIFCFYGEEENQKPLYNLEHKKFKVSTLKGNHHYEDEDLIKIVKAFEVLK